MPDEHTNPPTPPEFQEQFLDEQGLGALIAEVEATGERLELRLKASATAHSRPDAATLGEAVQMLRDGALVGLQVRYEVGSMLRWDIVMRVPAGEPSSTDSTPYKLVRVESELQVAEARARDERKG